MWHSPTPTPAPRLHALPRAAAIDWQPSHRPDPHAPPRWSAAGPVPCVPSLFDCCMVVLNEYVDCIESLLGVPDSIKVWG